MKNFISQISGVATNPSLCPDLDLKTRVIGFILSFIIGFVMMLGSIGQLFSLVIGGERWFAIWYTSGNLVCLSSSFFLMGPKKQCENMLNPIRATVSLVLLGSMIWCLVLALLGISKLIVLVAIGVQFCALIWYVLSYIPYGRTYCGKCVKGCMFGTNEETSTYSKMV